MDKKIIKQIFLLNGFLFLVALSLLQLSHLYANDSRPIRAGSGTQMVYCPRLYINDQLVPSTNIANSVVLNSNKDCMVQGANQSTRHYFTSTIVGAPVGITSYSGRDEAVAACPTDYPVVTRVTMNASQFVGTFYTSPTLFCCRAGFTAKLIMEWVPIANCA